MRRLCCYSFFFFNDTATTEIYTLSLHDALPICARGGIRLSLGERSRACADGARLLRAGACGGKDRKSTRLNSSHSQISYAVFCLKKKKSKTLCIPTPLVRPAVLSRHCVDLLVRG